MAVKELGVEKPIVMRIKGNMAKEAQEMVESSGLNLYWEKTVDDAVDKALSF